jgi:O-antigen ligase
LKPPDEGMTGDARWTALFDRIALFLTLLAFLLRIGVPNATAGTGLNLFIHLMIWVALTLWFAGRALGQGGAYRFTSMEFPFLAFNVFGLVSVLRASFKLPALDHAFTFLSLMLFFILCVQVLGKQQLLFLLLATLFTLSVYALVQRFMLFPMLEGVARTTDSSELAQRIRSREVFASLGGPNQFAGFLALLLPLLAGSMIDTREFRLRGAALAVGLVAIVLTGSLGGWVALACGAATMGALALTRAKGRSIAVGVGCGVAVLAAILLASGVTAKRSHSMHVREVYWKATGPIVSSAPMLGVGLDNWQEHFYRTKPDVQQETTKTHNDYLQILSETGIFGFLGFAGLLVLGLRKALTKESAPMADPDPPSPWLVAGVVSIVMLFGLTTGDAVDRAISIVLAVLWLAFWFLLRRMSKPSGVEWTRIGAAGGFVALLVHMLVDFQIYQFGVAAALVAVLALIAMLRGGAADVQLPKGVCLAATGILMAVSVPLLTLVDPRALAADNEIEDVQQALAAFERRATSNPTLVLSEAIQVAESAQKHNPFDPVAYQLFFRAKRHERDLLLKVIGSKDSKDIEVLEGVILQALENAIALRPLFSPLQVDKSQAHLRFRRYHLKSAKEGALSRAKAAEHLRLAVVHQRRAYELYPTRALNAYLLARVLETSKDPDAPRYYAEALRLHDLVSKELENFERLKLDAIARARALRSLGKAMEAHDVLDAYLRQEARKYPPEKARAWLESWIEWREDEMDETMTPVAKNIVDAIMRDLK